MSMDHLPLPKNPIKVVIEVPYLCKAPYDEQSFYDFPQRQGFRVDENGWLEWDEDREDVLAFYQTWLYFGLLYEFFGQPIRILDFTRSNTRRNGLAICSASLPLLIGNWKRRLDESSEALRRQMLDSARDCLRFAVNHCAYLERPYVIQHWREHSWANVVLAIRVLINSLAISFTELMIGNPQSPGISWPHTPNSVPPSLRLLTERMEANGWCPYRLRFLTAKMSVNTFHYLASLRPNTTRRAEHHHCQAEGFCKGDSIPQGAEFRPKHISSCDEQCAWLSPPMHKVKAALTKGHIPIIICTRRVDGSLVLDVVHAQRAMKYTAVTHVWADGLGKCAIDSA